jgi:hypothetical protein
MGNSKCTLNNNSRLFMYSLPNNTLNLLHSITKLIPNSSSITNNIPRCINRYSCSNILKCIIRDPFNNSNRCNIINSSRDLNSNKYILNNSRDNLNILTPKRVDILFSHRDIYNNSNNNFIILNI